MTGQEKEDLLIQVTS